MHEGKVVMRTKDAMSHESWLPLGGLQFAIPIFKPRVLTSSPRAFSFVVAGIHPLVALRSCIEGQQERVCLVRSASTYPLEQPGAAYQWWLDFLNAEQARADARCSNCRDIKTELAGIVVP